MTQQALKHKPAFSQFRLPAAKVAAVSLLALSLVGCRGHYGEEYGLGMGNVSHDETHAIVIDKQPVTLSIPIRRGAYGLVGKQRMRVSRFLMKYRTQDMGNSKLLIEVPSGSANEVAAMEGMVDLRHMISEHGFDATNVQIRPYAAAHHEQPPIRLSYAEYVAKAPECGNFPTNLASQHDNRHYENFGCSSQRNLAAMVANPADLVGPRTMTPRSEERRRTVWKKFIDGQSTGAQRSSDEKSDTTN